VVGRISVGLRDVQADGESPPDGLARVSVGAGLPVVPRVSVAEELRRVTDVRADVVIAGAGTTLDAGQLVYRFADPVLGEQNRPVGGVQPITITLDRSLEYVRADQQIERRLRVTLRSFTVRPRTVRFRTLVPPGLRSGGLPDSVVLQPGATQELYVTLSGRLPAGRFDFGVAAASEGTLYVEGFTSIEYPHIRPQRMYRQSSAYLLAVPVNVPRSLRVLYVKGVSDAVAPILGHLDIPVTTIEPSQLPLVELEPFTTVVIGPRAYEASPELSASNPRLFEWVRAGGTMVVQYGQFEMAQPGMMPYPVQFTRPAARVTLEGAPVRILDERSKLLRWPNRITERDWDGWTQERALYMPSTIDERYRTPIAMNDPNEPEQRGAILDLPMGRGRYIYTSLSLFRQLPGGVPGSARLLVNLLSAGLPEERAMTPATSRTRVVIIGGGFGGLNAARALAKADVEMLLIDRTNHHLFQPLLYQVATTSLAPSDITAPIRWILRDQRNVTTLLGTVEHIDRRNRAIRVKGEPGPIHYDYLIVAPGTRHSYFGNDAWERWAPGLKSVEDARRIRKRFLLAFERAEWEEDEAARKALLTFVIVGGGPTGRGVGRRAAGDVPRGVPSGFPTY
jgi:hypothetical protein